ncbi:DUF6624 domain-containing protein [Chitinophaga nivalis]|uniref:Tetratricopeptide repeat protein n=1 Tax=Chitinophaga nivalis TaxID=2991709 RepID=A0ABT3IJR4_9BACT|nr:DUF6624 domain-containing protein [Chitinophaga nivalis]MCW3466148.1 hypothetical protein [Chitinophaga nivalis]MCW3484161.1 hypothetical protein [Chitinophaga nivalis]
MHPITWAQAPDSYFNLISKADTAYRLKDYATAAHLNKRAFDIIKDRDIKEVIYQVAYNTVCYYTLASEPDTAFTLLQQIVPDHNFIPYHDQLASDPDLTLLHTDKRWKKLAAAARKTKQVFEATLNKPLVATLATIHEDDQHYRLQLNDIVKKYGTQSPEYKNQWVLIKEKDSANLVKINSILDQYGWQGPEKIGFQGSQTLFLVIQHADIATQLKYLPLLQQAVKNGQSLPSNLALLEDRTRLRQGKKQRYGSQITIDNKSGQSYVQPLEDPDHVDERRATVGLAPMATYLSQSFQLTWDVEQYKKMLPEIEAKLKRPVNGQ